MPDQPKPTPESIAESTLSSWMGGLGNLGEAMPPPKPDSQPPDNPTPEPPKPESKPPAKPADKAPEPTQDKPEASPASNLAPDEDKTPWPRTADAWKKHKETQRAILAEKKAAEEAKAKLESELAELKKKGTTAPPDYEQIKQEREELDRRLREISIENHPKFKSFYDGKEKAILDRAKAVVGADRADALERALKLPDSEYKDSLLDELTSDLTTLKQGRLMAAMNELSAVQAERSSEVNRAKENWQRIQAQEQADAENRAREVESFVGETLTALKAEQGLGDLIGDSDLAMLRTTLMSQPKDKADGANRIRLMAQGAAYPALLQAMISGKEQIKALEAKVAELTAATPRAGAEHGEAAQVDETITAGSNPLDVTTAWIKGLQRANQA